MISLSVGDESIPFGDLFSVRLPNAKIGKCPMNEDDGFPAPLLDIGQANAVYFDFLRQWGSCCAGPYDKAQQQKGKDPQADHGFLLILLASFPGSFLLILFRRGIRDRPPRYRLHQDRGIAPNGRGIGEAALPRPAPEKKREQRTMSPADLDWKDRYTLQTIQADHRHLDMLWINLSKS